MGKLKLKLRILVQTVLFESCEFLPHEGDMHSMVCPAALGDMWTKYFLNGDCYVWNNREIWAWHNSRQYVSKPIFKLQNQNTALFVYSNLLGTFFCIINNYTICYSQITEYRANFEYIRVPSNQWGSGCFEDDIVCCGCFTYRKSSDSCLSE